MKKIAIVPAYNEEGAIGGVVEEILAFDPAFDVLVIDDGSYDGTAAAAAAHGAKVVQLPYNLGIGGSVQTGFRYAYDHEYDLAARVDGDGQHDPSELPKILRPLIDDEADIVVGSRFTGDGAFRSSFSRRIGIRIFAWTVSAVVRQKVTDTTSGFRAVNRQGIRLFAADYPHDYPEVEATVMVVKHRLRLTEVPVTMRERAGGVSSINAWRSIYYMAKVLLGILVSIFRKHATPLEDDS
jgi:hypothetical protein